MNILLRGINKTIIVLFFLLSLFIISDFLFNIELQIKDNNYYYIESQIKDNNIMKFLYLLLCVVNSEKIIKNININSCRNCIHYKPYLLDTDFTSKMSNCKKFGNKDVVTDKITYDYADLCRIDESKCGKEGKFFESEENVDSKVLRHKLVSGLPYFIFIIIIYYCNNILL